MTTSRVIRGNRAKIFLYVCAALILTGLIACYNNTLSQLDDIRKSKEICHQQEENLSTQLQVISDYKQRLENSLKTEKAEHQQSKIDLENKLNEEKTKSEKYSSDTKLKLNSLQQNYNLLQTQHDDFKQDCEIAKQKQLEDINDLQSRFNEIKSLYVKSKVENEKLQDKISENQINKNDYESKINHLTKENNELRRELESLKHKCSTYDTLQEPKQNQEVSSEKNFNKMSEVSPSLYSINNSARKQSETSGINVPQIEKQEKSVIAMPNSNDNQGSVSKAVTKSGLKPSQASLKPSQASLDGARPLLIPTTIKTDTVNKDDVLGLKDKQKLPKGVVAVPEKKEESVHNEPEIFDNRYQIAKESANEPVDKVGKDDLDKENAAHEVLDAPQNGFEELGFGDQDHYKNDDKQNFNNKNNIEDPLGHDYKEEDEDDDDDPDSLRQQPPPERN